MTVLQQILTKAGVADPGKYIEVIEESNVDLEIQKVVGDFESVICKLAQKGYVPSMGVELFFVKLSLLPTVDEKVNAYTSMTGRMQTFLNDI